MPSVDLRYLLLGMLLVNSIYIALTVLFTNP